ncbi:MAG: hypothetical protein ACTTKI_01660 [Tannerella sp.]|uniref:hypothetical protein n=1 Tax=Tannerella sp. TaxID=2382127 RepID=UPI003FA222CF
MRQFSWCAAALAATVMLTSCLDGGSNSQSGTTVGVVRLDTKTMKHVLDNSTPIGPFYSPSFKNVKEGACIIASFDLNYDAPENASNVVKTNGYYTVVVREKAELDQYMIMKFTDTGAPDTAKMLEKEVALANPNYQILGYVKGYLFVGHALKQPEDQRNYWFLTYNADNMVKEESGERIYDVFLRAKVKTPGTKSEKDMMVANAYQIKDYLETAAREEQSKGNTRFYLRFNYASSVKDGKLTWAKGEKVGPFEVKLILDKQRS